MLLSVVITFAEYGLALEKSSPQTTNPKSTTASGTRPCKSPFPSNKTRMHGEFVAFLIINNDFQNCNLYRRYLILLDWFTVFMLTATKFLGAALSQWSIQFASIFAT